MRTSQLFFLIACAVFVSSQENSCRSGFKCVQQNECRSFQTRKRRLIKAKKNYGADSTEYKSQLRSVKDFICSKEDKKVCCRNRMEKSNSTKLPDFNKFECGMSESRPSKVVGGESTQIGEFPWMALLGSDYSGDIIWDCGGSIINKYYILSAAHCDEPDIIRVGEWRVDAKESDCMDINGQEICGDKPQDILPEFVLRHPGYRKSYSTGIPVNDIMLVRLKNPVKYSEFVKPVCLPIGDLSVEFGNFGENAEEKKGVVVGWGKTQDGKDYENDFNIPSQDQFKVNLPVLSNERCLNKFQKVFPSSEIVFQRELQVNFHFCAGGEQGRDSCKGDSGGSLVFREDVTSPFLQLGIVSAGTRTCGIGAPSLYTRVTAFMDWIVKNLK